MPGFNIVTLFPEFFDSPLKTGLLGKALASGLFSVNLVNPRDFSDNKHRHVDDSPYGGGPGMVIRVEPVFKAVASLKDAGRILLLTPAGKPLNASLAAELSCEKQLTLICGRYEGIDSRIKDLLPLEEVSVGEAVLNGGETAALAVIESVARFMPGFLGKAESAATDSYADNLLEYDQFTRPEKLGGFEAPPVLLSGNHKAIARWRRENSLQNTARLRPELLDSAALDHNDAKFLASFPLTRPGRNLSFCLMHYPVRLEAGKVGVSSLTNLDIHDIARVSHSYGLAAFYVLTPLGDQLALLRKILDHWSSGPDTDRGRALQLVRPVRDFAEMEAAVYNLHGVEAEYVAASAQFPKKGPPPLTCAQVRAKCACGPVVICLGTARGLAKEALKRCSGMVRPIRFCGENHLSVRSAAAILADRILGDYY